LKQFEFRTPSHSNLPYMELQVHINKLWWRFVTKWNCLSVLNNILKNQNEIQNLFTVCKEIHFFFLQKFRNKQTN